jgi:hypothetical protein
MILSSDTKQKFNLALSYVKDGWSLQIALKMSGLSAYNEKCKHLRKTEEFKIVKYEYMKQKNKGEHNGFMEQA